MASNACLSARSGINIILNKKACLKLGQCKLSTLSNGNYSNKPFISGLIRPNQRTSIPKIVNPCVNTLSDWTRLFCTSKQPSEIKGLADEILKSQVEKNKSDDEQKEKEEKAKADEFSKRMMKYSFVAFGVMFTGSVIMIILEWGAPLKAEDGSEIRDEFSDLPIIKQYIFRTHKEFLHYDKLIKDPSREKLLPDPLKEPYYQPPYTLVLEMTGVLVHPDWTYKTGWRFKKRPGVDFFLQQVGPPLFEVVIYTAEQGFTAFPIIDGLDPNGHIMYRLFRDATRYLQGHHVKDLSCLNRDLSKVIMIDWNDKSVQLNKENSLVIKKWAGDDENRDLMDLALFLRTLATNEVDDVRPVLQFFGQFDDPVAAFKENLRKLSEENEEKVKQIQTQKPSLVQSLTSGFGRR